MTDDDLWRKIEALARGQEPAIREIVLDPFASLMRTVDTAVLARAREQGPAAVLAREVDALPPRRPADTRSDDDILDYNERGSGDWPAQALL